MGDVLLGWRWVGLGIGPPSKNGEGRRAVEGMVRAGYMPARAADGNRRLGGPFFNRPPLANPKTALAKSGVSVGAGLVAVWSGATCTAIAGRHGAWRSKTPAISIFAPVTRTGTRGWGRLARRRSCALLTARWR